MRLFKVRGDFCDCSTEQAKHHLLDINLDWCMAGQQIQHQQNQCSCSASILETQLHSRLFLPMNISHSINMSNRPKASCHFLSSCNMVMHAHLTIAFFPDTARKHMLDGTVRPGKCEMRTKIITALFTHTAEHAAPGLGLSPGLAC